MGSFLIFGIYVATKYGIIQMNTLNNNKIRILVYIILFVMILPLLYYTFNLRVWGDEVNMEVPLVRQWLETGNLFVEPSEHFSEYSYPRLWVIMLYQSLILHGEIHEAAGRWLTILIIFLGSAFVWEKFYLKWELNKWISLLWASFWMILVIVPMFAWSASWYYSVIVSILVMISFYYLLVSYDVYSGTRDLKFIVISSILMAMVIGIRPDGFLYLPLAILLLFIQNMKNFRNDIRKNILSALIIISPSAIVFFSWRFYLTINSIPMVLDPFKIAGNFSQLFSRMPLVTIEMIRMLKIEWNQSGFWFICLVLCSIFSIYIFRYLKSNEKQLLFLLTVPVYKFFIMIFENSMHFTDRVRLGRHLMQTAPILYFLLGFLVLKWINSKFGAFWKDWSHKIRKSIFSFILLFLFMIHLSIGLLYAYLPSGMNNYIEHWVELIKKDYPEYKQVQMIYSAKAPPSTRIHPLWRYYATKTPDIFSELPPLIKELPSNILFKSRYIDYLKNNGTDALLIYGADKTIGTLIGLTLDNNKTYLINIGEKDFEIVQFSDISYPDIWMVPWRMKAINHFKENLLNIVGL